MAEVYVFILRGGLVGVDGFGTSHGMDDLGERIRRELQLDVHLKDWSLYAIMQRDMMAFQRQYPSCKKVLIGFSGGGKFATWVALREALTIDLMVGYDPSPKAGIANLHSNVRKALCYHNNRPLMLGLGGGQYVGSQVETVEIAEWHMWVQSDKALHDRTIAEIRKLKEAGGHISPDA